MLGRDLVGVCKRVEDGHDEGSQIIVEEEAGHFV